MKRAEFDNYSGEMGIGRYAADNDLTARLYAINMDDPDFVGALLNFYMTASAENCVEYCPMRMERNVAVDTWRFTFVGFRPTIMNEPT